MFRVGPKNVGSVRKPETHIYIFFLPLYGRNRCKMDIKRHKTNRLQRGSVVQTASMCCWYNVHSTCMKYKSVQFSVIITVLIRIFGSLYIKD